jgi:uncharacterized protein YndB with AHSA1/START domain
MTPTPTRHSAVVTLPSDTEILITRVFDAPRRHVWTAYTEPEYIRRWWAGQRGTVTSAEVDLRVGGTWRYVMTAHGDVEVAFHGEYREIEPLERLVHTEVFEGMPDAEALDVVTFEEHDGRTTLSILMSVPIKEIRDGIIESGMEDGMQEGMDLLEEIAIELA